jgi:ornithine cyclodeaminase
MNLAPTFPFSIVTGRTVYQLIGEDLAGCVGVVRDAYLAHAEGRSVNPPSFFLRFPDRPNARIIGLPSHLAPPMNLSGIKWISSYPDNIGSGFPRASAVLILNSHEHGYPFACLEASVISASRTAASAVLAASHLSVSRRARNLGLVGTGLIARYVYQFLMGTGWEVDAVNLYDLAPQEAERFAAQVCQPGRHAEVRVSPDLPSLLMTCDLILFATVAARPHVHDPKLLEHCPVVLHLSLRDLAPELLLGACNIVDDINHVMHADTSPHLTERLTGSRDFVTGTLADVITGRCAVDHSRPRIFSPFGLGILDLAVGKWVYDRAVAAGDVLVLDDFFYDLQR